jgi:hypothetical protein
MSIVFHTQRSGKAVRRGFVALALVALSLVLARPVCDAYEWLSAISQATPIAAIEHAAGESVPHSEKSSLCCVSVDDGALVASAIPVPTAPKASFLISAVQPTLWPLAVAHRAAVDPPETSRRSLPYHARSARILV